MTLKQILTFDVNRILQFDVNRILRWDVGAALTRPITNPLLKIVGGWLVGIMLIMMGSVVVGISPSDRTVSLLALGLGVAWALFPTRPRTMPD
jgi:hypothetical protein